MTPEPHPPAPLRPHIHDGISEYDNPPPRWIMAIFMLSIVWSVGYMLWWHATGVTGLGAPQLAEAQREARARAQAHGALDEAMLLAAARDPAAAARGAAVYARAGCAACHGPAGTGTANGPNLLDAWWVHGSQPMDIATSIRDGRMSDGVVMPRQNLATGDLVEVVAWIAAQGRGGGKPGQRAANPSREKEAPIAW